MIDRTGEDLGRYHLTRLLGSGGFASVYLGEHRDLHAQAAIKVMELPLTAQHDSAQFRQEAQTIANLIHPHIVRVLDFGNEQDCLYLVMGYAPYGTLRPLHPAGSRLPLPMIV